MTKLIGTTLLLLLISVSARAIPATPSLPEETQAQSRSGKTTPATTLPAASRGQLLYETYCEHCHDSTVHIRKRRNAKNRDAIRHWVIRWAGELRLQWNSGDVEEVVRYLNRRYYRYSE